MSPARLLRREGGVFAAMQQALMGVAIPFAELAPDAIPADLRPLVLSTWQGRFVTELRSVQIMNRFLAELLEAGDPLEVYAGAVELIADEVRHMALCAEVVQALGGQVALPEPPVIAEPEAFRRAPASDRALATAISMLAVNETCSVAFIQDLHARCDHPVIRAVLHATAGDEEGHEAFGWTYLQRSLARYPIASLPVWRAIARDALAPLERNYDPVLASLPPDRRHLDHHPEPELVRWGLTSPTRQALVFDATRTTLRARLAALGLA